MHHRHPGLLALTSDATLVALTRAGDERAFSAIVARHQRSLRRQLRGLLAEHELDDAVQQALLRALQALRAGAEVRELAPWLGRIARNVALTELARRAPTSVPFDDLELSGPDSIEARGELEAALAAIQTLPERQRIALTQASSGQTHAAIALRLGVSEGMARQIVHRARASLRASLGAILPPPIIGLVRRIHVLAERLAASPGTAEPFVPKLAAAVAVAAAVAIPATLHHGHAGPVSAAATAQHTAAARASRGGAVGSPDTPAQPDLLGWTVSPSTLLSLWARTSDPGGSRIGGAAGAPGDGAPSARASGARAHGSSGPDPTTSTPSAAPAASDTSTADPTATSDAGTTTDATGATDPGTSTDASAPTDPGTTTDSSTDPSAPTDAGTTTDATGATDPGTSTDASAPTDPGTTTDPSGTSTDTTTTSDPTAAPADAVTTDPNLASSPGY